MELAAASSAINKFAKLDFAPDIWGKVTLLQGDLDDLCSLKGNTFAVKEGPFKLSLEICTSKALSADPDEFLYVVLFVDGIRIAGKTLRPMSSATITFATHHVGGQERELTFSRPVVSEG